MKSNLFTIALVMAVFTGGCTTSQTSIVQDARPSKGQKRAAASYLDEGDETIDLGFKIPIYKDLGDLKNPGMTGSVSEQESHPYASGCNGMKSPAFFKLNRTKNCVDVQYVVNGQLDSTTKYCDGEKIQADGRKFKIVQVMDRCLVHPTIREDGKYANLFRTSPIVRLEGENGQRYITEVLRFNSLVEINHSHEVNAQGRCGKKHAFFGANGAKECAVKEAKEFADKICTKLSGKLRAETLKETTAPYMCYTEAFNEEFCAVYTAQCDF